jgi:DNA-binding MltR family transcriptional regulator
MPDPNPEKTVPLFIFDFESDDIKEFFDESPDRGLAISLPAILDNRLTSILKVTMRGDEKLFNELFQPSGPLGNFKTKINLVYMLGIVDKEFYQDLLAICKIRNYFAHRLAIKTLEQHPISAWIKGMEIYRVTVASVHKLVRSNPEFAKTWNSMMKLETQTMRDSFRICIRFMILRLNEAELVVKSKREQVSDQIQKDVKKRSTLDKPL